MLPVCKVYYIRGEQITVSFFFFFSDNQPTWDMAEEGAVTRGQSTGSHIFAEFESLEGLNAPIRASGRIKVRYMHFYVGHY